MSLAEATLRCTKGKEREFLEGFYEYLQNKRIRDSTINAYLVNIRKFRSINRNDISVKRINDFLEKIHSKKNYLGYLRIYAEFKYKKNEITRDELDEIKEIKVKNTPTKRTEYIKSENVNVDKNYKFTVPFDQWGYCYQQLEYLTQQIALWLGFNFGLRRKEISLLQWKNINLRANILKVRSIEPDEWNPLAVDVKTDNGERDIPITPKQKRILLDYKEKIKSLELKHDYVIFSVKKHLPIEISRLNVWFAKVFITVDIEGYPIKRRLHPHIARYTFMSLLFLKNGLGAGYFISKLMGHSELETTLPIHFNSTTQEYLVLDDKTVYNKELEIMIKAGL